MQENTIRPGSLQKRVNVQREVICELKVSNSSQLMNSDEYQQCLHHPMKCTRPSYSISNIHTISIPTRPTLIVYHSYPIHNYSLSTYLRIMPTHTILVLLLLLTATSGTPEEADPTSLSLMKSQVFTQEANSYAYYQLTLNTTKTLLLLSLSLNETAYTQLFLSLHPSSSSAPYFSHPNDTHFTQECDLSSFDTCIVRLDQFGLSEPQEITVYFSVYVLEQASYELWAVVDDIYSLDIASKYRLDFSNYESGMLELKGGEMEGWEEVVMVMTYDTTGKVGRFKIEAAVDQLPNGQNCCLEQVRYGQTVGAFSKILVLPVIHPNQSYFILIEGQKGTKFSVHFFDSHPSSPALLTNSTLTYLAYTNTSYSYSAPFPTSALPLYLTLTACSGYGLFEVNYCSLLQTSFQNINGQNEEIVISAEMREQCRQKTVAEGEGLLVENLEVRIKNVEYEFGYQIGLYEGLVDTPLRLNQLKYGTLTHEKERTYEVEIVKSKQPISVRFLQIGQSPSNSSDGDVLAFEVEECRRKHNVLKCTSIADSSQEQAGDLTFTPQPNHQYRVKVSRSLSSSTTFFEYLLQLEHEYEATTELTPFRSYLQEVQENQYNFYTINLTRVADEQRIAVVNNTQLVIRVREVNGDVLTLVSQTVPQPTFEKYQEAYEQSEIVFSWSGTVELLVNASTEAIYIAVKGNVQSLYTLQYTIDVEADIPAKYLRLSDGSQTNFMLTKSQPYQLFSFASHAIPYRVIITNSPSCIRLGTALPLPRTCHTSLPSSFSDKVLYFNVSNGNLRNFRFSVYVNSGQYTLTPKDSILFGCEEECYQEVAVQLEQRGNVIHEGRGQIYQVGNPDNLAYNSFLGLECMEYPCVKKINATLPYGGQMSIFLQTAQIQELEGRPIPVGFGPTTDEKAPKKFIYSVEPWREISSILVYSQALPLEVYYSVVNLREIQANVKNYEFPTPQRFQGHNSSNPLRKTLLLSLDQLIQSQGCRQTHSHCLVCLSIYPNLTSQHSEQYLGSGLAYVSPNTFAYFLPLNTLYRMQEAYSTSLFTHRRTNSGGSDSGDSYSGGSGSETTYRIHLQPLSNCHPKLFSGLSSLQKPHYGDLTVLSRSQGVNFTVLAESQCQYDISITDSKYMLVSSDRFYQLEVDRDSKKVTVLFRSQYSDKREIAVEVDSGSVYRKVRWIGANVVDEEKGQDGGFNQGGYSGGGQYQGQGQQEGGRYVPASEEQADFQAYDEPVLVIKEKQSYKLYIITVELYPSNSSQQSGSSDYIQLLIRQGRPLTLARSRQHRLPLPSSSVLSLRIYTAGSIALFLASTPASVSVTISKDYNQTEVTRKYLSAISYPWLFINASSLELTVYDVTIGNGEGKDTVVTVMYEENDALSWNRLYRDIAVYDAFTYPGQKNCYYFQTQMLVGVGSLSVDFVVGKNQSEQLSGTKTDQFQLEYSLTISSDVVKATLARLSKQPLAYRLTAEYVAGQNYTLCFHTSSASALGVEYYLVLTGLSMEHLVESLPHVQVRSEEYDLYELVQEGYNELLMIEVTSCLQSQNGKKLVGSASFVDAQLGRYTDLLNYYKTRSSTYAQLEVAEGYYYLGVQNRLEQEQVSNFYSIRYQSIEKEGVMLARAWELGDSQIVKIYQAERQRQQGQDGYQQGQGQGADGDSGDQGSNDQEGSNNDGDKDELIYKVELPQVDITDDQPDQPNIAITYTIAILPSAIKNSSTNPNSPSNPNNNSTSGQQLPLDLLLRCPQYTSTPGTLREASGLITRQVTYRFDNASHFRSHRTVPVFTFSSLPETFNITGRVALQVDSQQFSFYYDNSRLQLNDLPKRGLTAGEVFAIVLMVLLVVGLAVLGVLKYLRVRRERKEQPEVDLSNFHSDKSAPVELDSWRKSDGSKGNRGKDKSQTGKYGELVDELN